MSIMRNLLIVMIPVMLALLIGGIFLQIFLSKKNSRWFGLILPAVTFFFSLLLVLGFPALEGMGAAEILLKLGSTFLIGNIPTIVLLGIYFGCREKMKTRAQLEKMNIQDLD